MAIRDKYRFIITTPSGQFTATPDNPQLSWKWRKQAGENFFIKELETQLKFINESSLQIKDFDQLYKIERSGRKCDRTEVTVEKQCGENGWTEWFHGYIALVDGNWKVEHCTVKIKPRSLNGLACLVDHWEEKSNLINLAEPQTATWLEGEREEVECCDEVAGYPQDQLNPQTGKVTYLYSNSCLDGEGWSVLRNEMTFRGFNRIFDPLRGAWKACTTWIREKYTGTGTPNSPGWMQDGGDYVRPIQTISVDVISSIPDAGVDNIKDALFYQQYASFSDLSGGMMLNDILVALINRECQFDVVSNFLGINPDATNPTNIAYDFAFEYLQELMVFDINALRFQISEPATTLNYAFKKLWDDLKILFNLKMREKDGKLYIEHTSFFKDRFMMDLTREDLKKHLKGKWEYKYRKEELPKFESFEYGLETQGGYFRPLQVKYEGDCVTDDENKTDPYVVQTFAVNLYNIFFENEKESPSYPADALALVATKNGVINRYPVTESGYEIWANGVLTWPVLFDKLHKWGRKKKTGIVKRYPDDPGVNTEFFGRPKNKEQVPISLPMCCEDINQFAPEDYVKTQLGWGEVDEATFEEPGELLTLKLMHD